MQRPSARTRPEGQMAQGIGAPASPWGSTRGMRAWLRLREHSDLVNHEIAVLRTSREGPGRGLRSVGIGRGRAKAGSDAQRMG